LTFIKGRAPRGAKVSLSQSALRMEQRMANLTRFNPFDELLGDFGKGFWIRPFALPAEAEVKMKIDVSEDDKAYTVKADIPGVSKEDIHVDIEDDHVSLSAEVKKEKEEKKGEKVMYSERSYGVVSRTFTLPGSVDAGGAKAEYKDGVLNLVLPKKAGGNGRRIAIG
jgi:HSP20 family protein